MKPVNGYGAEETIVGHWDESTQSFFPNQFFEETIKMFISSFPHPPVTINVTKKELDGNLNLYRSFGSPDSRTVYHTTEIPSSYHEIS